MTRGIDNIYLNMAKNDSGVFGHYGNTLFPFEIHTVHDSFPDFLTFPEQAALPEHGINQGGFAVIDMGNDGHITNIFHDFPLIK
jgi:hypothetical protein